MIKAVTYLTVLYLTILATLDSNDAVPLRSAGKAKNQVKTATTVRADFSPAMLNLSVAPAETDRQPNNEMKSKKLFPHHRFPHVKSLYTDDGSKKQDDRKLPGEMQDLDQNTKAEITLPPLNSHEQRTFRNHLRFTAMKVAVDMRAPRAYYPDNNNLDTVCIGRSTVYNIPPIRNYLKPQIIDGAPWSTGFNKWVHSKMLFMDLRLELYRKGRSEECHVEKNDKWQIYLECALRRNQRMEYMIPKYPLHQVDYHYRTSLIPEYR